MKKVLFGCALVLAAASVASAALGDVNPDGLTGLWRFQNSANTAAATIGTDIVWGHDSGGAQVGPWTIIEPGLSNNGIATDTEWGYLQVFHGISPNGGGSYVNEYTIVMDYKQTSDLADWNSLFQTAAGAHDNDGDLFTDGAGHIGIGAVGYSTLTYDASTWHRIALSVDNDSFFRVYVDGVLFLDGAGQGVDGRFSLYDYCYLLADDTWSELGWGLVGTVATWNRAMGSAEVADLGGWIDGAATPTPLRIVPEPATLAMLTLGGLFSLRRNRK